MTVHMAKFYSLCFYLDGWVGFIETRIRVQEVQNKKQKQNQHSKHLPNIKNRTCNELGSNSTTAKTTQNRNGGTTPNTTS